MENPNEQKLTLEDIFGGKEHIPEDPENIQFVFQTYISEDDGLEYGPDWCVIYDGDLIRVLD